MSVKLSRNPQIGYVPRPVVIVSCSGGEKGADLVTVSWTGVLCSCPLLVYISLRPNRYTYGLIKEAGDFVINIPAIHQAKLADYCGIVSGRKVDKVKAAGLTLKPGVKTRSPYIHECPINLECIVKEIIPLGTHDMFTAELVYEHIDQDILDEEYNITTGNLLVSAFGEYWGTDGPLGQCFNIGLDYKPL